MHKNTKSPSITLPLDKILHGLEQWRAQTLKMPLPNRGDYVYIDQLESFPRFSQAIPRGDWLAYAWGAFNLLQQSFEPVDNWLAYLRIELATTKFKRVPPTNISYQWLQNNLHLYNPPKLFYIPQPAIELLQMQPLTPHQDGSILTVEARAFSFLYSDFYDQQGGNYYTNIAVVPTALAQQLRQINS